MFGRLLIGFVYQNNSIIKISGITDFEMLFYANAKTFRINLNNKLNQQ